MQLYRFQGYMNPVEVLDEVMIAPGDSIYPYLERGYYETANNCDCVTAKRARLRFTQLLAQEGVEHEAYRFHFSDFEREEYAREAVFYCKQLIHGKATDPDGVVKAGVLICGGTGCGKTTLGSLVIREGMVMQGKMAVWTKYATLEDRIRATYEHKYDGPSKLAIQDEISFAPLLQIDDLGSLTRNELYAEDILKFMFNVFDHRCAKQLPTLITTNVLVNNLQKQFGQQVMSRVRGLCHGCVMNGPDWRVKGRN